MITHPILSELATHGIRMGLSNLRSFLTHVGLDLQKLPNVIHVGGTNGKGSVCRMLESIYLEAGYVVGLYTSPHLQNVNERIRVSGRDISDVDLTELLVSTQRAAVQWANDEGFETDAPLTYFEMMTAVALQYFVQQSTEIIVLEVGLGGRLDATNIVSSSVSCIVSVDLDHTDVLGDDLTSIATEKAGIIKEGQPVVIGRMQDEVARVLRFVAESKESQLYQMGRHFQYEPKAASMVFQSGTFRLEDVVVGLEGAHQLHNAALVIQIIQLQQNSTFVPTADILKGLERVQHSGRLEWLNDTVLLDAAHNPAGAEKLAEYLQEYKNRHNLPMTLLLGCSMDKDLRSIGVILGTVVDRIFATQCAHPRAKSADEIVKELKVDTPIFNMGDVENAIQHCRWGEEIVVVAGSIFLVGAVKDIWSQLSV